jgi:uncharacterized protein
MMTRHEIEQLHRKYAPSDEFFDAVYTHCQIVCEIAEELVQKGTFAIDADLVYAGALLHDIGIYRLVKNGELDESSYIQHGIKGYELLKEGGLPEEVCRFASHHTGTGITKADIERQNLPLPPADYLAETDEELLVMYADKFHSKLPFKFNRIETYKEHVKKYGEEKVAEFERMVEKFGIPDIETLAAKYGHPLI